MAGRKEDGAFRETEEKEVWSDCRESIRRIGTMGLPLLDIEDATALEQKVSEPLVEAIEITRGTAEQ